MDQPLVSVIVPIYKVEKYLNQCLDSIVNQTYKNLEIILVDDGSPDNSGKIADEYAEKDNRIKVIHKKNAGVSRARNDALDVAKGDYIVFEDSDDYMPLDAIELMYKELVENEADISSGTAYDFRESDGKNMNLTNKKVKALYTQEEALKEFFLERYFACIIWGRMYKKEAIGGERFNPDISFSEDFDFLYRVLKRINKFALNTNMLVNYYRVRTDGLGNHKYDKRFEVELELSKKVLEDVKQNYPQLESYAVGRLQRCVLRLINRYFKTNKETKGVDYLFDEIKKYPMKLDFVSRVRLFFLKYLNKVLFVVLKIMGRV